MCEAVERYANQKADLKAIKATVLTSIELGADKDKILEILKKNFSMTEDQAEVAYERYAPAVV